MFTVERDTVSPFSIGLIFPKAAVTLRRGGGIPAGIWGLIQELVTNDSYSGFYNRVAAKVQDSNKLVVRRKLWHLRAQES